MKRIIRHIDFLISRLDISPLSPGGLSKELIVVFWGLNAVLFLAHGLLLNTYLPAQTDDSVFCTVTKKISKADLYTEDMKIVHFSEYIIISSYNSELPTYDVLIVPSGRSPPVS